MNGSSGSWKARVVGSRVGERMQRMPRARRKSGRAGMEAEKGNGKVVKAGVLSREGGC